MRENSPAVLESLHRNLICSTHAVDIVNCRDVVTKNHKGSDRRARKKCLGSGEYRKKFEWIFEKLCFCNAPFTLSKWIRMRICTPSDFASIILHLMWRGERQRSRTKGQIALQTATQYLYRQKKKEQIWIPNLGGPIFLKERDEVIYWSGTVEQLNLKLSIMPMVLSNNHKEIGWERSNEHRTLRAETLSGEIVTVWLTEFHMKPTWDIVCVGIRRLWIPSQWVPMILEVIYSLTISKIMYKRNRPVEYRFNQAVFLIPSSLSRIRVLSIAWWIHNGNKIFQIPGQWNINRRCQSQSINIWNN